MKVKFKETARNCGIIVCLLAEIALIVATIYLIVTMY